MGEAIITTSAAESEGPAENATLSSVGAAITEALCAGWQDIRRHHPDVPDAVVTMGTRHGKRLWAHFWAKQWSLTGGETVPEVWIAAEGLARGAADVMGSLLHEAAHGRCSTRGEEDCNAAQYHNKFFRDSAQVLGLSVERSERKGYSITSITDIARQRYREPIAALEAAIRAERTIPASGVTASGKTRRDTNYRPASCQCRPVRTLRAAAGTWEGPPVICGGCNKPFVMTS
ncbi:hypothetical protein ACFC09_36665 [Streptomyces sp. NPDC056161]|uniref:hypothetical protein n=1 Tax=unclassified Streptomyces TaxID=2593676 RepID=UPI0004C93B47|nr:hypothetical protein [Streptomyces sp. NRRL S-920]